MLRTSLLLVLVLPFAVRAEDWPQWRGPGAAGVSTERNLPVRWSGGENVKWKVPLQGAGVSCPVVWRDRIFLTASTGRNNDQLHVTCHARKDGALLWHTRLLGTTPTDLFAPGGMAVPTPATDGERVYVLFGTGDLAALDLEGRPVWVRSLAEEYGPFRNRWGMGTSPILVDDLLIVQVDHWSQSYLLGVDRKTGKNRWKTDRDTAVNWTSPLPIKGKGATQLVAFGTYKARGYDAATGKELWSVDGLHQQCIPSPVPAGDLVIATSGVSSVGIRLDGKTGDITGSNVVWTNKKAAAFLPSPVSYDGLIYLPGDKGIVLCLEAKSGKQVWKERLGGSYYASPVAGDGKVYFSSKEGVVYVVKAGRAFETLAENDLGEGIVASPAVSGGAIFLRGEKHLFCIADHVR
ncbi:MAG: PQQ-binding-like beta-propeller repeat protein [Gemmataceae bacterium]